MKLRKINKEQFQATLRKRKSAYRQEVLKDLKEVCSNPEFRGQTLETPPLKEKLSTSTLNWLKDELVAAGYKEVILGCTTVDGDKKHMDTVTIEVPAV